MVPSTRQHQGPVAGLPVLGVLARKRTYRHLALLLLLFPVGIVNFVLIVAGLSVGASLVPLVIGIPILGLVLVGLTWLAWGYARILSNVTEYDVSCSGFSFGRDGFWRGLRTLATRPRPYVLLVAFLVSFPLGVGSFAALVTVFTVAIVLVIAPFLAPLPITSYRVSNGWVLDSPPEVAGAALLGFVLLVAGLWAVSLTGEALARAAAAILDDWDQESSPDTCADTESRPDAPSPQDR